MDLTYEQHDALERDSIKASFDNGNIIQFRSGRDSTWIDCRTLTGNPIEPLFIPGYNYRVRPEGPYKKADDGIHGIIVVYPDGNEFPCSGTIVYSECENNPVGEHTSTFTWDTAPDTWTDITQAELDTLARNRRDKILGAKVVIGVIHVAAQCPCGTDHFIALQEDQGERDFTCKACNRHLTIVRPMIETSIS